MSKTFTVTFDQDPEEVEWTAEQFAEWLQAQSFEGVIVEEVAV